MLSDSAVMVLRGIITNDSSVTGSFSLSQKADSMI